MATMLKIRLLLLLVVALFCSDCKNTENSDYQTDNTGYPLLVRARLRNVDKQYQQMYDLHSQFKENTIKTRRFEQADIAPLIQRLPAPFKVSKAGKSVEGRDIFRVSLGTGPTQVLLWSQMHGDESTATMALLDIFNFFNKSGDGFDNYRKKILSELTLTFLPMLNPDGAARYQRRNAMGVDLNRDAMRLQCPESQILKQVRDELRADWGFNLHDQGRYYVGDEKRAKIATFSFLAPPPNVEKEVTAKRADAMQLIGFMNQLVQAYLPGKVGRYDDTFEPRAFGDNIQKWGTRTILVECGLLEGDPEKQAIRRLHFMLLLAAFDAIAEQSFEKTDLSVYNSLPYNDNSGVYDLIVREAQVQFSGKWYTMDVGFKRDDVWLQNGYVAKPSIAEFGDLSVFPAYDEIVAPGYRAIPGKVYPTTLQNVAALKQLDIAALLAQGYTEVRLREAPRVRKPLPINILSASESVDNTIRLGRNPNFVLQKDGSTDYAVVNGLEYDLRQEQSLIRQLVKDF